MVVRATSLGDVHTMVLYPAMASHRDLSPKHRARLGIHDGLVRVSVGIEAVEDINGRFRSSAGWIGIESLLYCGFMFVASHRHHHHLHGHIGHDARRAHA